MSQLNASAPYVTVRGRGQSEALGSADAASSQARAAGSSPASPPPSALAAKSPSVLKGNGAMPVSAYLAQVLEPSGNERPLEARKASPFPSVPPTIESEDEPEGQDEEDAPPSRDISPQVSPASTPRTSMSGGGPFPFSIQDLALPIQPWDAEGEADLAAVPSSRFDRISLEPDAEVPIEDEGAAEDTPGAAIGPTGKADVQSTSGIVIERDLVPEQVFMRGLKFARGQRTIESELLDIKGKQKPLGPFMAGVIHGMGLGAAGIEHTSVRALWLQVLEMGKNQLLSSSEIRECFHAINWASTKISESLNLEAMIQIGSREGHTEKEGWEKNLAMISWSGPFAPTSEGKADGIAGGASPAPAEVETETDLAAAGPATPPPFPSSSPSSPPAKPAEDLPAGPPPPGAPDLKASSPAVEALHAAPKADYQAARATITRALAEFRGSSEDEFRAFLDSRASELGIGRDHINSITKELADLANQRQEAMAAGMAFITELRGRRAPHPESFVITWSPASKTDGASELAQMRDQVQAHQNAHSDRQAQETRRGNSVSLAYSKVHGERRTASQKPASSQASTRPNLIEFAQAAKTIGITNAFDPAPASPIASPISPPKPG